MPLISVDADRAGFALKPKLVARLVSLGCEVQDLRPDSPASTDDPDYAHSVATRIEQGAARRAGLLCATGRTISYVASQHPQVRAPGAWAPAIAQRARKHNDANILVLPARFVSEDDTDQILDTFLAKPCEGGRQGRRVEKIEPKPETT